MRQDIVTRVRPLLRAWRNGGCAAWFCAALLTLASAPVHAEETEMKIGDAAPDFSLVDQSGETRSLVALHGHWVVLYFYPKDDTPGCTTEACALRDDYLSLKGLGAEILGVSVDSAESHVEFSKKYHLPYPLLADVGGSVAKQYGALFSFWPMRWAKRHSFIIDPQGHIAKIYRDVDPKAHSRELIADLRVLQSSPPR